MNRSEFAASSIAAALTAAVPAGPAPAVGSYDLVTPTGTIFGTLLLPAAVSKPPVVLVIAGSGPTDRDCNSIVGVRTDAYKLLAESLAARGIASVRYDKRGVAASALAAPSEGDLRFVDYVVDAAGWISKLRADGRFGKIAVAGHSEGSLVGILAMQTAPADVFVSLEGAGRNASTEIRDQLVERLPPSSAMLVASERILATLAAGKTTDDVPSDLAALFRPSVQPYMISWFTFDPAVEIAKLRASVTIVQGTADLQVPLGDAKLLAKAAAGCALVIVPGMSHVLKPVGTAANDLAAQARTVYADPTIPIAPEVPHAIATALR